MIVEIISLIVSFVAGIYLLYKIKHDIYPFVLKRLLIKIILKNWENSLQQILPVYNTRTPNSAKEAGILAQDKEWVIETPRVLQFNHEKDNFLIYGTNDGGNYLVANVARHINGFTHVILALRRNGETFSVSFKGTSTNSKEFSLGNFKLELVEPFRAWRLWYNGHMEWKPLDYACDSRKDANVSLLSKELLEVPFGENLADLNSMLSKGYSQFGTFHGIFKIDGDNQTEDSDYFYGFRSRRHTLHAENNTETMEFFAMNDINGDAFRLVSSGDFWVDGKTLKSSMLSFPILSVDASPKYFKRDATFPKMFEVKDEKMVQRIEVWPKFETLKLDTIEIVLLRMEMNGKPGHGLMLRESNTNTMNATDLSKMSQYENTEIELNGKPSFVSLQSDLCLNVSLVGGKAASLRKLAAMEKTFSDFSTAKGFCATTEIFRHLIHQDHLKEIFQLKDLNIEEKCFKAIDFVKSKDTIEKLKPLVAQKIEEVFGTNANILFAVRSSGVLEDGAELSCAGQNETFLGVNETGIAEKIVDCWASLYTTQSVKYRLNHGQPAITAMGVVIQEMVSSSAAGVLFTANPQTGNPFEILITANYGLGESVVSGACDPDSVILQRSRSKAALNDSSQQHLSIEKVTIGDKKSKIALKSSGHLTELQQLSEDDSKRLCLSEDKILRLGEIGKTIEKYLGQMRPIDIEWAINEKGQIYILQCRPITSLDAWTDFEIIHQFDTAIRTKMERLTTANTGEVLPKPLYPIGMQCTSRNIDVGVQEKTSLSGQHQSCAVTARACPIYCNRVFISVYSTLYKTVEPEISASVSCADLTVFGRPVITKEVHAIALERYGAVTRTKQLKALIHAIKLIKNATGNLQKAVEKYGNWKFVIDTNLNVNAKVVYGQITRDFMEIHKVFDYHCSMSEASSSSLVFAFLAVAEGKSADQWDPSMYEDTGKLLSSYSVSVESAELPSDMEKLVDVIIKEKGMEHEEFSSLKSTKDSLAWLTSNSHVSTALTTFLEKHGHRSVAEMDIGQDSWSQDPTPLIALLRNIMRNKLKTSSNSFAPNESIQSDELLLESLKTKLKPTTKKFLKFLLPYCRKMVSHREKTKSLAVRISDQIKKAYGRLGELMVQEHLIPEKSLLRHFTHHEIGLIIDGHHSTSALLTRAMRRARLYPLLESFEFEEICVGIPKLLNSMDNHATTDIVYGTPVSAGKIKGIAKVCLSVEECASQIEEGDILITKATDIAFSPFFPMLGGGAVVAREYGLPCIVGAANATKVFKSGQTVILDTSTGTISKVVD